MYKGYETLWGWHIWSRYTNGFTYDEHGFVISDPEALYGNDGDWSSRYYGFDCNLTEKRGSPLLSYTYDVKLTDSDCSTSNYSTGIVVITYDTEQKKITQITVNGVVDGHLEDNEQTVCVGEYLDILYNGPGMEDTPCTICK